MKCFTFNIITCLYARDLHIYTKYDEYYGREMDEVEEREVLMDNPILVRSDINWDEIERRKASKASKALSSRRTDNPSVNVIKYETL